MLLSVEEFVLVWLNNLNPKAAQQRVQHFCLAFEGHERRHETGLSFKFRFIFKL